MNEENGRHSEEVRDHAPLVVHVVHDLSAGGLENGLINIVRNTPSSRFRHLIVALGAVDGFAGRLPDRERQTVALNSLTSSHVSRHLAVLRLLRRVRPSILHTRNLPTVEFQLTGLLAGVPVRIHSEHGRDAADQYGRRRKYRILRRAVDAAVTAYVTVNEELAAWLREDIHVESDRIRVIPNGVDTARFKPPAPGEDAKALLPLGLRGRTIIGSVGRMEEVKDHANLVNAFLRLRAENPAVRRNVGLVIIGDGVTRAACSALLETAGATQDAWLPGTRFDVDVLYRAFDVFVLPSLSEGMSNTILEAMAVGLPVVATDVGAARELVTEGESGLLVPPADSHALAAALSELLGDACRRQRLGEAGRSRVGQCFSLDSMVNRYLEFYDSALGR